MNSSGSCALHPDPGCRPFPVSLAPGGNDDVVGIGEIIVSE